MQSASKDLKGLENERERLIMEKEAVIQEQAALETQLASLETLINNLKAEVDEQKLKVNSIKNAHHEAESELKLLRRKIKECDSEINGFYKEQQKLQHQISESSIEKKKLENEVDHPIHDQAFYLNFEHKKKLKDEFAIKPWTFVQKLGDAVFIPSGCPHQVRNLKSCIKVALDFVSPENIQECINLTEEFRRLPSDHRFTIFHI